MERPRQVDHEPGRPYHARSTGARSTARVDPTIHVQRFTVWSVLRRPFI